MKNTKRILSNIFATVSLLMTLTANAKDPSMAATKVKIIIGDKVASAVIYDNPTAKEFLSLLPLKLTLKDYASTEKVSDLPKNSRRKTRQREPILSLAILRSTRPGEI